MSRGRPINPSRKRAACLRLLALEKGRSADNYSTWRRIHADCTQQVCSEFGMAYSTLREAMRENRLSVTYSTRVDRVSQATQTTGDLFKKFCLQNRTSE